MDEPDEPDGPVVNGRSWTVEELEDRIAGHREGPEPETIREVAQERAYRSGEPRDDRLRWAALSLAANRRLPGDGPGRRVSRHCQEFMMRMWVVDHLGRGTEAAWDPEVLAADTLAALWLEPGAAEAAAAEWRSLPIERIGELRYHRSLTGHVDMLLPHLAPGPLKDQLMIWQTVREHLP